MQKDMHYACVKVLANKAGFSLEEAGLIAYASQYTDDATMHRGIKIYDLPDFARPLVCKGLFEPICTAHKGIDLINGFWPDTQEKVFIPFHYLPGKKFLPQRDYDYRVEPGSDLAFELLHQAAVFLKKSLRAFERSFSLIRLGIALHAYFDTWSHDGFSGRWSEEDNDVSDVYVAQDVVNWKHFSDFGPDIGHAEIRDLPDWPFVNWRAENYQGESIGANNSDKFLIAADTVYAFLCQLTGAPNHFYTIREKLKALFRIKSENEEERTEKWKFTFHGLSFFYDETAWRWKAIGNPLPYDQFESRKYPGVYCYRYQGDDRWLLFHLAAAEQRQWVLERIKPL